MFLQVVSYIGTVVGFLFLTLSIASGLYYVSEIVEEHSEPTRRFLSRAIYTIMVILVLLLLFDKFPFKLTLFSIISHVIYYQNLKKFPFISLTSPTFILSCLCVILNHYFWFKYFNHVEIPPQFKYNPNYVPPRRATFSEVASFFALCIWFIPFALFVSLSAGDYVLPTTTEINKKQDVTDLDSEAPKRLRKKTVGLARVVINNIRKQIRLVLRTLGFDIEPEYEPLAI
ncbi:hypothetical protein KAFR_0B01630 [Kazachstania africana CBS 2517]|uniref:Protein SVP26 n=1 Tax=Kazachstania africana (strain ATCC 22294 / BCRC 22015 / CBS 2517 / CECT 1963 / NBRC 1671 / NRRL Y-8276) TaxID=1071382 RepID=H2AQ12_KAZAF|nr:hypothetical protein KAFR_0B01630 [Kazachstania africana CBS 2517]CCF56462.1 hypothetical protein KAFR_0B01630 [Kazachstania africana CBS 2517]